MGAGRRLSGLERLWLVADRLHPPFVNQMVLEGQGVPDPGRSWSEILERVSEAHPAARARLHGRLMASRWLPDGPPPAVQVLDAPGWDGCGPAGASFLSDPLDPQSGPTSSIVVVRGAPARVVLRTHHALMDGQGTLLLARGLFAALRGEPVPEVAMGPLNDAALARRIGARPQRIPPADSAAPSGTAGDTALGVTWERRRVEGRPTQMLPRLALALARWKPRPPGTTLRIGIPVDLRAHAPELRSSANLTGLLRIDLDPLLAGSDPLGAVTAAIQSGRERSEAAGAVLTSEVGRYLPLGLMTSLARWGARRALLRGRYVEGAILSNLGRLPLGAFSGAGFVARRCFFVPPGNPGLPLFLAIAGDEAGVELCATVPSPLAAHGQLTELLDVLARGIRPT